jgi:branched-chain amino acid transport system ATP-binding protein
MTSSLADRSAAQESGPRLLLDVQSISAGYGDLIAVRDVSVQASPGELVAIVGRNGAGKSTTLLAIAGMLKVRSGAVVLDGSNVTTWPVVRRITAGMSCVPEGRQVFRRRTVTENLELGTYPLRLRRAVRKERLESTLERFPMLAENRNVRAHQLSGGQQQLLAIAQALMAEPRVLLLDEPSAGLSPGMFNLVLEVVDRLKEQGTAVILVEQLVNDVLEHADRLVILDQGQVVHIGPPGDDQFEVAREIYLSRSSARNPGAPSS